MAPTFVDDDFSSSSEKAPISDSQFDRKCYNVTDHGCQWLMALTCPFHFLPVIPGFMGEKTMILEEEEAVLRTNCRPFCTIDTRRPYGELGSVDKQHCLCCTGVASNLSKGMPICIGWGCNDAKVSEIVQELKVRMKARGDTGQIARTEEALQEIKELRSDVAGLKEDMKQIMKALNVPSSLEIEGR